MYLPRRTSPATKHTHFRTATVATTALLALLAALFVTGRPTAATTGQTAHSATATGDHLAVGPHATDACDTACTLSTATRPTPHGEHPTPRNHLTSALAPSADAVLTRPRPAAHPSTTRRIPSPEPLPPPDRDRAPPASSGI